MTLQAAFCATLVDEWVRAGVTDAVLAPGSRSAPLAHALVTDGRLRIHVRLDERSAAYLALGIGLASGAPAVLVTTSGTAAVELHPAVAEADLAGVPLICCTADRPPELHRVGAPQTLEQEGLFGSSLRFACAPGVPDAASRATWRSLAARLVLEATAHPAGPGPVHANLAFREPLVAEPDALPAGRAGGAPWHVATAGAAASAEAVSALAALLAGRRRVLVLAGAQAPRGRAKEPWRELAAAAGLVLAEDGRGWPRDPGAPGATVVGAADHVLRSAAARAALVPDLVIRLGSPPASKALAGFLDALAPEVPQVLVDPHGRTADPERRATLVVRADPGALAGALAPSVGPGDGEYAAAWAAAEAATQRAFDAVFAAEKHLSEPGVARTLVAALPAAATVFASSSMPVRDLEWFARPRAGAPRVLANRGANGIDGVSSTVVGVAAACHAAGEPAATGLVGDLAFLHDLSALVFGAAELVPPARLVVVDNGGGGIFSFLPYAAGLPRADFERVFATPQRVDVAALAAACGHDSVVVESPEELAAFCAREPGGLDVAVVVSERRANLAAHRALEAAAVAALDALF